MATLLGVYFSACFCVWLVITDAQAPDATPPITQALSLPPVVPPSPSSITPHSLNPPPLLPQLSPLSSPSVSPVFPPVSSSPSSSPTVPPPQIPPSQSPTIPSPSQSPALPHISSMPSSSPTTSNFIPIAFRKSNCIESIKLTSITACSISSSTIFKPKTPNSTPTTKSTPAKSIATFASNRFTFSISTNNSSTANASICTSNISTISPSEGPSKPAPEGPIASPIPVPKLVPPPSSIPGEHRHKHKKHHASVSVQVPAPAPAPAPAQAPAQAHNSV
ncbi:uncharacterized protein [Primulina huaijiensis]|uniref:uncharacterized protein n=1 Tax=Primulina huaijiensis TaxID=1492673 RepID=UPI003CC71172